MNIKYKIQAKSKIQAIEKLIREKNIKKQDIIETIELKKPISYLIFFTKNGEYQIEVNKKDISEKNINKGDLKKNYKDVENTNKIKIEELVTIKAINLLKKMGLDLKVEVLEAKEHYILLNLSGEDNGIIIGKKGKTLNSFENLLNSLCKNVKVEVDVEGFKAKRAETLRDLGRKMAEKALNTKKTIRLNPMPPKERKIIHEIINKYKGLDTYSDGRDPKRYVVIKRKNMR